MGGFCNNWDNFSINILRNSPVQSPNLVVSPSNRLLKLFRVTLGERWGDAVGDTPSGGWAESVPLREGLGITGNVRSK